MHTMEKKLTTAEQLIIKTLHGGTKTTLEISSQFRVTIKEALDLLRGLERQGLVWRRKTRGMGNRNVSRWGLKEE